jgi:DNA-binding NarL/FixJ family response regulator
VISLYCIDDNDFIAEALMRRLRDSTDLRWAGWSSSPDALVALLPDRAPDVLLLDIDIPGQDTFALVRRLTLEAPALRVIFFSGHVRASYIDRAFEAGAWGYASKNDDTAELLQGVRAVARGEVYLSPEARLAHRAER